MEKHTPFLQWETTTTPAHAEKRGSIASCEAKGGAFLSIPFLYIQWELLIVAAFTIFSMNIKLNNCISIVLSNVAVSQGRMELNSRQEAVGCDEPRGKCTLSAWRNRLSFSLRVIYQINSRLAAVHTYILICFPFLLSKAASTTKHRGVVEPCGLFVAVAARVLVAGDQWQMGSKRRIPGGALGGGASCG